MAKIQRFEDLEVWQHARTLCNEIFKITEKFGKDYRFISQITASAGSTMDNIAEGFERDGRKEFIQFLFIAKGSCGETRSQIIRASDFGYISKEEFEKLYDKCRQLSSEISGFIRYLRNTDYTGTKFKPSNSEENKSDK